MSKYGVRLHLASCVNIPMIEVIISGSSPKYLPFLINFSGKVVNEAVESYEGFFCAYSSEKLNYPILKEDEEVAVRFMITFKTQMEVEKYLSEYFIPTFNEFNCF